MHIRQYITRHKYKHFYYFIQLASNCKMLSDVIKTNEIKEILKKAKNAKERIFYIVVLAFTTLVLLLTVTVAVLINQPDPERFGLNNTIGRISDQFLTQITPSDWAFKMFSILLTWQALWVAYAWTLAFRQSFPLTVSTNFLILFSFANISIIAWSFTSGNQLPQFSFPLFSISVILLYTGLGYQTALLNKQSGFLRKRRKFKFDFLSTRFILINGVSAYVTWLDYMLLINIAEALQFFTPLSGTAASVICLTVLLLKILIYFNLETTLLDQYLRYVVAPYPIIIWGLSGVVDIQNDDDQPIAIFTIVILSFTIFQFILKIFLIVLFIFVRPLTYPTENDNTVSA